MPLPHGLTSPKSILKTHESTTDCGSHAVKGISPLLKNALLSGVAVGMWEGSSTPDQSVWRKNSIQITCDPVDSDSSDHDVREPTEHDQNKYYLSSPFHSDNDTTTADPSTGNTSSSSSSIESFSAEFDPQKSPKRWSEPWLHVTQPGFSGKRHSIPGDVAVRIEPLNDNDMLKIAEARRKSDCSYKHLQVVSTV